MKNSNYAKYIATWGANNGSTVGSITGNNKRELRRDVREICKGNCFAGQSGEWSIIEMDLQETVYKGTVKA